MGIAYYYGLNPTKGAVVSAVIAAIIIGLVSLRARQHEDTVIGALWAIRNGSRYTVYFPHSWL